jgi:hypothetical protein
MTKNIRGAPRHRALLKLGRCCLAIIMHHNHSVNREFRGHIHSTSTGQNSIGTSSPAPYSTTHISNLVPAPKSNQAARRRTSSKSLQLSHLRSINYGGPFLQRRLGLDDSPESGSVTEKGSFVEQAQHGFLEGVVRGYRNSLLTQSVYSNLTQCENLEGKHTASLAFRICPEY